MTRHPFSGSFLPLTLSLLASAAAAPPALAAPAAPAAATAQEPRDWKAATRADILASYDIYSRRHPGMFDPNNPDFPARLKTARDSALRFAEQVDDAIGHSRALGIFSAGLRDGHAVAYSTVTLPPQAIWPGFTTVWRGDALHVHTPGEDGPPRGSMLIGCDGTPARPLIEKLVFQAAGRPAEAGHWWTRAPNLFYRLPSKYVTPPARCEFHHPDGKTVAHQLRWRPMPEEGPKRVFDAVVGGDTRPIGLSEPRPGIFLISLPDFQPDAEGRTAYDRLFADLDKSSDRLQAARAIVIDLRRNNGGSSSWSNRIAQRLWGEKAVETAMGRYFRAAEVWWLADQENAANFRASAARFRAEGNAGMADWAEKVFKDLEAARQRGDRFFVEKFGTKLASAAAGPFEPRKLPPVYVITYGSCASACNDALDVFTQFPGVKLIGAPTSGDSSYMEVLSEDLPSGLGKIVIPSKIWVGRPRGGGEIYQPHIVVRDLDWSADAMLDHVERDLKR